MGGPGIICEVDESMFSYKPKNHRGRSPEEPRWVFGIFDTSFLPALSYMEFVENRSAETLIPIIQRICIPGTIIHADGWRAYQALPNFGYAFSSVNHSLNFVDPNTGVHTQHIESYWAKKKLRVKMMKGLSRDSKEDCP